MQENQSLPSRIYYRCLALLFAFAYRSSHSSYIGVSLSSWIKALALLPLLVTSLQGKWGVSSLLTVLPFLCIWTIFWRARLNGYVRFVPDLAITDSDSEPPALPSDYHVKMWATGLFDAEGMQEYALLRPAEYWQVPLGTHIFMVRVTPQSYRYQILDPESIREVRPGCLLFSTCLHYSLAITFVDSAAEEPITQFSFGQPSGTSKSTRREHTFYLTFDDRTRQETVRHHIAREAQRQRE